MTNTNNKGWTTIVLKNGKKFEGVVWEETTTQVTLYKLPFPIAKRNIATRDERKIVIISQMYA